MNLNFKSFFALVAVLIGTTAAQAFPAQFIGTWRNVNPNSSGIVRLVVSAVPAPGTGLQVQAFGACTPTPCNIGTTQLRTYGSSVTDMNHRAANAHYNLSFKDLDLVAYLQGNRNMYMEHFNYFKDTSGRQNYVNAERMRKVMSLETEEIFQFQNEEPEN